MVVLIVEDEILIGMELQMTLRMAGHQVGEPAGSAEQALRVAAAERPDLAFVDVNLEGGAEGIDLARELRDRHDTTCVFLTAQPEKVHDAHDAALGVITKPYDPATVVGAVEFAAAIRTGGDRTASARRASSSSTDGRVRRAARRCSNSCRTVRSIASNSNGLASSGTGARAPSRSASASPS